MNARRLIAALAVFAVVATGLGITIGVITADKPAPPVASAPPPPAPRMPTPAEFQIGVVVTDHEDVLLYRDGSLIDKLGQGMHVFWKGNGNITWKMNSVSLYAKLLF